MIKDFNGFEDGSSITADICIVGSGAAGITIAREFIGARHTVVMLESGGFGSESEIRSYMKQKSLDYRTRTFKKDAFAFLAARQHYGEVRLSGSTFRFPEAELGSLQRLANFPPGTRSIL